ncbi:sulfurtransferase/chromate resistance protein [Tabrizicola sp.]|uniref:sulfurtransferase/chromate resistance protein n=1 Tax=Tabrizicola sp. TaxID=2005166 RepID=UPI00286CFD31|nr:sulfurtransferase/chromate resistance protein [Tabrizicola sp.]
MPGPTQITPAQLMRLIGTPDAPVILDVRIAEDLAADPRLIPGSSALPHTAFDPAPTQLQGQRVTVACQRGRKLSEGVAAVLRAQGITAESLEGGTEAWAAGGLPMIPIAALPPTNLWVTRHRPKVDRIACPWLIRRFIDPAARFLFVSPAEVPDVALRFNATPFDIEGVTFSHRGEGCTFDALLDDFALHSDALDRLALVIRAADTDRHDLAPQAAGLLALSVGLSRMFRDDLQQLDAGIALYDALYRWARDGHDEGHDWPAGRNQ